MGKNGKFGKDYGKVVGKDAKGRPGWKGPGYVKKPEPAKPKTALGNAETNEAVQLISSELQQLLLNVFKDTFLEILTSDALQPLLQSVKTALYERDFARAFGQEDNLEAYSARWSPSRALCYASILVELWGYLARINVVSESAPGEGVSSGTLRVACFGGGAAEIIAFGGLIRFLQNEDARQKEEENVPGLLDSLSSLSISDPAMKADVHLIDTAAWKSVVDKLHQGLISPPPLSKYASASAREANTSLIPAESLTSRFSQEDVFRLDASQLSNTLGQEPMLLTLLFTLNELYTTSISRTTNFLLKLTLAAKAGTLLLVVDSPGSYSETTVGSEAKKYPMQWLLDHTLMDTEKKRGGESAPNWERLISEDSQWFRLPDDLRYSIPLENMRYQIHLYRRT